MRKEYLIFIITFLLNVGLSKAQSLVSPIWKISTEKKSFSKITTIEDSDWQSVNLLLSWERQGYSWMHNNVCIRNTFVIDNEKAEYETSFSLQCNVKHVYINDVRIGGDVPNTFWSERGKKTKINIPPSVLMKGENKLTVILENPSYTGGLSHNVFEVYEKGIDIERGLKFAFSSEDHVFSDNGMVQFHLECPGEKDAKLNLVIKNDYHDEVYRKEYNVKADCERVLVDLSTMNLEPGYYECTAIYDDGFYDGSAAWFTVSPERVSCEYDIADSFDDYWKEALTELSVIAPNFRMRKVDSLCSDSRIGYVVEMQSLGNLTIRGYYFVPKGEGPFPVVLHLPGYSYGFDLHDHFLQNKSNIAELAICVRGHGISADVFNPWEEQTLWSVNICDAKNQVYKSVYMDCVRAVEFLKSRSDIDRSKIGVAGGSQGGGLAIATAGLLPNDIAACAFFDPFLSDIREHSEIREIIKEEFAMFLAHPSNTCSMDEMLNNQDLIDVKDFAGKIKCNVYFEAALFDDDCPVHIGFAAYNLIQSKKEYKIFPNDSHLGESGEYGNLYNYIAKQFSEE